MKQKKIMVINGPNLNMLGIREPAHYGTQTLPQLTDMIRLHCQTRGVGVSFFQSNHEGALVDAIQSCYGTCDGIVINPGAYTHTSIALLDALKAVSLPTVEVHISDVAAREAFRQISYLRAACVKTISGHGAAGYLEAIDYLLDGVLTEETV